MITKSLTNETVSSESIDPELDPMFARFARTRDPQLRDKIVNRHRSLARFLASKFANRGEPIEDLFQVAMIALVKAIDRFEPGRGVKFTTWATPVIVGEIRRYFRDFGWQVKVARSLQERNQAATKAKAVLQHRLGRAPTVQEVAESIGATEEQTLAAMELGYAYRPLSFDAPIDDGGGIGTAEAGFEDAALGELIEFADLDNAIDDLEYRQKAIIRLYYFDELSQCEIADRLQISQMHVSRLQRQALKHLRSRLAA
jgi:RNA polymerase sigma-B factor